MNSGRLILRSLRFYGRTHLGVLLGVALASAILTGALAVGDSVRATLDHLARARLGRIAQALVAPDRFFRAALAGELSHRLAAPVAPVLLFNGSAGRPDGAARANDIQVAGVDERFWRMGAAADPLAGAAEGEAAVNARLAAQLQLQPGDSLIVRIEKPSPVSRDAPLSGRSDATTALRLRVRGVVADRDFGRFSLRANQVPPGTVFLPLAALQEEAGQPDRANTLLAGACSNAEAALRATWQLADAGLELRALLGWHGVELRTERVFLDPAAADVALGLDARAEGVLTYFANELRKGERATPYSFVAGVGRALRDDEIQISRWLAEDLEARPGDAIALRYFVLGDRRELREETASFRVREVYPDEAADPSWMPAFPGLADAHDCGDWEPGIPIDMKRIRPKDEKYWDDYRGTPKAFVSLAAAQRLWTNRFGRLTAVRFPGAADRLPALGDALRRGVDPAAVGLSFTPVLEQALQAGRQAMDFGGLFIGFSFFLIVSALLLTALLFVFNLEQRHAEVGLLGALGFRPRQVRRILMGEGAVVAVAGALLGIPAGMLYAKLALLGLSTVWRGAVGAIDFQYRLVPASLLTGACAGGLTAWLAMWFVLRRQLRRAPAELLARGAELEWSRPAARGLRRSAGLVIGAGGVLGAIALLLFAGDRKGAGAAEVFFGAGGCLLVAGLGFCQVRLAALTRTQAPATALPVLGVRNAARRSGRSLAAIGLLAAGIFLFVAVSAFQQDPRRAAGERASGTGGFALYAQSALPVYDNPESAEGRRLLGLDEAALRGAAVVPLRLRAGDEASCLNLNRAQQLPILGVNPDELAGRGAFTFASKGGGWALLDESAGDGAVPAIGDVQTVTWALGRKLGDTISVTDDHGRPVSLRIVGLVAPSILQGGLLISERHFTARFASSSGYRVFLIDAPAGQAEAVAAELSRALQDRGLEVRPAWRRLADFAEVENTYLRIFQALGGLGLLLGSLGFGVVVMRNLLERRRELALLQALGFSRSALLRFALGEHGLLIRLGLATGTASALVAVLPSLLTPGAELPLRSFLLTLGGLAGCGYFFSWLAARAALRGSLLPALRSE